MRLHGNRESEHPGKWVSSKCWSDASGESVNSPEGSLSAPIEQIGSFDRDLIKLAAPLDDTVVLQSCCFLSLSFFRIAALKSD